MIDATTGSLDESARATILEALALGATLRVACGYARTDLGAARDLLRKDADFAADVLHARCSHQVGYLEKLAKDTHLPAVIFALERRWPRQFARNRKLARKRKKAPAALIDLSSFSEEELCRLERAIGSLRKG